MKSILCFLLLSTNAFADFKSDYEAYHECQQRLEAAYRVNNDCWNGDSGNAGPSSSCFKKVPDCTDVKEAYEKYDHYKRAMFEMKVFAQEHPSGSGK